MAAAKVAVPTRSLAPPGPAAMLRSASLAELGVPIAVLAIVVALITPLPPFILDLLIVTDIMTSVIVMMVAMYITRPVEFSVFPTTLLLLTLFRLALNISSSRLILMDGNTGTRAAGEVIEAFGNFVVGGNYVIGAVIFLTLIAIQYVVINHGAVRISEVTARFTLDALPGKQMSIDADLNAGLIDESEARDRRKNLAREAEFYGAMDGASRFTQRDAIASILITSINIIAGFLIGVLQHNLPLRQALETYTVLTIGDGLVTVIPALMISISGGLIVTRASTDQRLGADFKKQVFGNAEPLLLASCVLVLLSAFPGLPKIPFIILGGLLGTAGYRMQRKKMEPPPVAPPPKPQETRENLERILRVEPLMIEIGLGLVNLVEGGPESPLLKRISGLRRQLASDLGYILPSVRVVDNLSLRSREYVVYLKGVEIARFELMGGCELAIASGPTDRKIDGQATKDPAFGLPAVWVPADQAPRARAAGYTVVDSASVIGTHLAEIIRRHSAELFSRQDAKKMLDRVGAEHPKLVEDLVPKLLPLATVQKVLQNLLRERVSIRDAVSILEALGEAALATKNPVLMTEYVRQCVRRMVVNPYLNQAGALPAYLVGPAIEQAVESSVEHGEQASRLAMPPQAIRDVLGRFERMLGSPQAPVAVVTSSGARFYLRQITETVLPNVFFLAHNEIPPETKVASMGVIQ